MPEAIAQLTAAGLTYECFCTRREIQEAPSAPHAPQGAYPGTCRNLTDAERAAKRATRPPAVRLRSAVAEATVQDVLHGELHGRGGRLRAPAQRRRDRLQPGRGGGRCRAGHRPGGPRRRPAAFHAPAGILGIPAEYACSGICACAARAQRRRRPAGQAGRRRHARRPGAGRRDRRPGPGRAAGVPRPSGRPPGTGACRLRPRGPAARALGVARCAGSASGSRRPPRSERTAAARRLDS